MNAQQLPILIPMDMGSHHQFTDTPPARVRLALDFFMAVTMKTMDRVIPNDVGFETQSGQQLTDNEKDAQLQACEVLSQYFAGTLKPDQWEKQSLTEKKVNGTPGTIMNCPSCTATQTISRSCKFCKGTGTVIITPITGA